MKPYVIKQGDYLTKIAHRLGFVAAEVWEHVKNSELRALRKNGDVLRAGDILFIPDEPRKRLPFDKEAVNRYQARVPRVPVKLTLRRCGEPLAGASYVVEGIGDESERKTDGDGVAAFEVDVHVPQVVVKLLETGARYRVLIGHLDPADTPSGARMRLTNLGYQGVRLAGEDRYVAHDDEQLRAALLRFQRERGLAPSGELDEASSAALVDAYGA